jgi:hypothetical protein
MGTLSSLSRQQDWLPEILQTVAEFGSASLPLVAWELSLAEEELARAWARAMALHLLEPVGTEPETGEYMYRVG